MLIIYTFVFSVLFRTRWGAETNDSNLTYALMLFIGIVAHGVFAECLSRSPGLVLYNVSFVKRVLFPLEILPWVLIGSALFHAIVSLCMLLIAMIIIGTPLHWTTIFLPVALAPLTLTAVGFSYFLSATGVFLRDISQLTGILTTVLLFLSPVFYSVSALPEPYRLFFYFNPLTIIIEELRKMILLGKHPDMLSLLISLLSSLAILWTGFWWFQRTRRGFADVV
jgi:lipopolysaccharide transport system permease protein